MATERKRITKVLVDALLPGGQAWDGEVPGFGVRCQARAKIYVLKYVVGGKQRFLTIGQHGAPWTPDLARKEAVRLKGIIAAGGDPAVAKQTEKAAPTVAEAMAMFVEDHVSKRKGRAEDEYRRLMTLHVLPALGHRKIGEVERAEIARLHLNLKGTPYQANRVLAVLSKFFNWCEVRGLRPDGSNPCRHIEKYREAKRERFLSEVELGRLGQVLTETEQKGAEAPAVAAAIRLLIFTGARLNEILTLQWSMIDVERRAMRLPDSKTGAKTIHLNQPALELLARLARLPGNPFVIAGRKEAAHLINLEKPWRRVRALAGLEDVRLHDLRHSFASVAAGAGLSLPVIGALLGHTQAATTARYAHLAADPIKAANDEIGARIAAALATTGVSARAEVTKGAEREA